VGGDHALSFSPVTYTDAGHLVVLKYLVNLHSNFQGQRCSAKPAGNKMKKYAFAIIILFVLVLAPTLGEAQCSMCKASVESSMGQKNSVAGGINQGILYLMAVPYLLIAFVFRKQIVALWRTMRGKEVADVSEE
jgi:hypothetical protein